MASNILQSQLTSQAQLAAQRRSIEELYLLVSALQQQVQLLSDRQIIYEAGKK